MCRVPVKLRELVKQRLAAAAEEIFELLERTIAEYEEETERQRRLLDKLLQPRVLVHKTADWGPLSVGAPEWAPGLDQGPEERPQVKEEQEEESSSPEALHSDIITSQLWKREEEDPAAPPSGPSVSVKTEEDKLHSEHPQGQTEHYFDEDQVHDQDSEMDLMPHSSSQFHSLSVPEDEVDDLLRTRLSEYPAYFPDASETLDAQTNGAQKRKIRHTCPFCGKAFVKTDNFKCHLRTHTGEKPFSCSVCGKRFAYHASFNNHRQLHSGEKPFRCSVCGKDFTLKIGLRQHMFTHNEEKPFSCSVCGKGFCVKQGLRKHMKHHSGGDVFHL